MNLDSTESTNDSNDASQSLKKSASHLAGEAPIKSQFLLPRKSKSNQHNSLPDDDAAEAKTNHIVQQNPSVKESNQDPDGNGEPESKRIKLDSQGQDQDQDRDPSKEKPSGAADKKAAGQSKQGEGNHRAQIADGKKPKGSRGQNHGRKFNKVHDLVELCSKIILDGRCPFGEKCKYSHDISEYLSSKPPDIEFPKPPPGTDGSLRSLTSEQQQFYLDLNYRTSEPFYRFNRDLKGQDQDAVRASGSNSRFPPLPDEADNGNEGAASLKNRHYCPCFFERGHCKASYKCRLLSSHSDTIKKEGGGESVELSSAHEDGRDESEEDRDRSRATDEKNHCRFDTFKMLQKRNANLYPYTLSDAVLSILDQEPDEFPPEARPKGRVEIDFQRLKAEGDEKYSQSLERLKGKTGNQSRNKGGSGKQKKAPGKEREETKMDLDELEEMMMNQSSAAKSDSNSNSKANADGDASSSTSTSNPSTADPILDPITRSISDSTPASSIDIARVRLPEKRRLDWRDKLYLAPLTTTGNLPFRRVCTSFGSDIHCGEMGLAESFLSASKSEWSLVKRHSTEKIFGTQICGSKPKLLIPVAELLMREVGEGLDFVDLNCGCPIDMVYNKGSGSALLDRPNKLSKIVRGMSTVLGEIPVTVKLRTGTSSKLTTHNLFPRLQNEFGVGAVTLHGRSRKQRYKNRADWNYIKQCTDALRDSLISQNEESNFADQEEMSPIPIFGNGDVYSWQEYYENKEMTGVDGEMIARGGLIKPWLFTEIKERRDWDISSRERLDIFRQFSSYGLSHWGTDTQGINTTRRFLCEAMSFTHRYIPIGILETLPSRLNDRPPPFKGRDDLETLLASPNVDDWIKLSEMFLGKAPEDWKFLPKHKSSSYEKEGDEKAGEDQG